MSGACGACEVVMVNGVRCHERGCPEAWLDAQRECLECGSTFAPEWETQDCCSPCCGFARIGQACTCAECAADLRDQPEEDAAGRMGTADYEQAPGA